MQTQKTNASQAALPPAPSLLNTETLFQGIHWHQRWEMFPGVFTPGRNDIGTLCDAVQLPMDLTGKRVLDVGAWHGCFSFECERRGAKEVVALSLEDPEVVGFNRLKSILDSKVRYVTGSTYTMSPQELGTFDVVIFFGVLYHLRYPLLAIDRLRSVCAGDIYVETHVIDNHPWLRGEMGLRGKLLGMESSLRNTPLWRQYLAFELAANDQSNWFGPNITAVIESFESAGFKIAHTKSWHDRAGFHGQAVPIPERVSSQLSYEGFASNVDLVGLQAPNVANRT